MGNGHSNRRSRHSIPQSIGSTGLPSPRPVAVTPPAGYPRAPHPTQPTTPYEFPMLTGVGLAPAPMGHGSHYYGSPYSMTNGQYYMGTWRTQMVTPPPPPPPPMQEPQETSVIRNDLNLSKASLKLVADEENPGHWLVAFAFDATVAGSICIFVRAKEGEGLSITQMKPSCFTPRRITFDKGLVQKYVQPSGTGIDISNFDEKELAKEVDGVFPLIVRLETDPKSPPPDAPSRENAAPGEKLPKWIQSQTTYAVMEKRADGTWVGRVLKQKLWVDGQVYELQEIYGIDSGVGGGGEGGDTGKECVICLSEPRDTTVLPCRHMCMCLGCANLLRYQSNRCPICRRMVESLLEINVGNSNDRRDAHSLAESQLKDREEAAASNSSSRGKDATGIGSSSYPTHKQ